LSNPAKFNLRARNHHETDRSWRSPGLEVDMRLVTSFVVRALVVFCVLVTGGRIARAQSSTLPVKRVVLYKHGIGYFERQGPVNGRVTADLRFREREMSDVLKTLTALDLGGGTIEAIAYDSQKPPQKVLEEFAFALSDKDTQLSLMKQLRGARIVATVSGLGTVTGSILGIDSRETGGDHAKIDVPRLSVFTDNGEVVGFNLFDAQSVRFEDAALSADVSRYLGTLRSTHRRDDRTVSIVADGTGERQLFVAYAIEQPVWKATYRIVLGEGQAEPLLQGWAVVDNASDEDWTDVQLSLVAGLPISFRQDLYTPRYAVRPVFEVNEQAVAFDKSELEKLKELGYVSEAAGRKRAAPASPSADAGFGFDANDAREGVESEAVTREIGDLLEYRIDHPVTIPRNRSALLPIVAQRVKGYRVALYDESMRATNPMAAVRLENTSGLSLETGPVMVLDAETYAGEAQLPAIKPGEMRYIPFAVDLGVKATTKYESGSEQVHSVSIRNGVMILRQRQIDTKTYTFDNKDDDARVVIVEHGKRNEYTLRSPEAPFETEIDRYRFRVELAAKATQKLAVVEAREVQETIQVIDIDQAQLEFLLSRRLLNADAEAKLRAIADLRAAVAETQREINEIAAALRDLEQNQDRIRKNLSALGASDAEKDLRKTYVDELKSGETQVKELATRRQAALARLVTQQNAVNAAINDLALDYTP
jgi:hypothetical protein